MEEVLLQWLRTPGTMTIGKPTDPLRFDEEDLAKDNSVMVKLV